MRVFHDCQLVFATLVSTGREPAWTYPGRFSIQTWFPHLTFNRSILVHQFVLPGSGSQFHELHR